jgi:hypothetical protein
MVSPKDQFYRRLEERFDLSFVRELVEGYANPSVLSLLRVYRQVRSLRSLIPGQRWVVTPMAGAIHNDRLLHSVY